MKFNLVYTESDSDYDISEWFDQNSHLFYKFKMANGSHIRLPNFEDVKS